MDRAAETGKPSILLATAQILSAIVLAAAAADTELTTGDIRHDATAAQAAQTAGTEAERVYISRRQYTTRKRAAAAREAYMAEAAGAMQNGGIPLRMAVEAPAFTDQVEAEADTDRITI